MKIIEYSPKGEAIPDAQAEERARLFLKSEGDDHIIVSTENFILASRALIHDKVIPHTEVNYLFESQTIHTNEGGRMIEAWPRGWCDYSDRWLSRLLSPLK